MLVAVQGRRLSSCWDEYNGGDAATGLEYADQR